MADKDPIYTWFCAALDYEVKKNWSGRKGTLAIEAGIKPGSFTAILQKKSKAKFKTRKDLAKVCGYEYLSFLEHGKNLLNENLTEQNTSLPEKSATNESNQNFDLNKGVAMNEAEKELLQVYKTQAEELKKEVSELKRDLKEAQEERKTLYHENMKLAKSSGEKDQELKKLREQQAQFLESRDMPASNQ